MTHPSRFRIDTATGWLEGYFTLADTWAVLSDREIHAAADLTFTVRSHGYITHGYNPGGGSYGFTE